MAEWIKRKTRTMVECDACKALICWNKMNGAKFDEYWQKGNGKRLCLDCYLREVEHDGITTTLHSKKWTNHYESEIPKEKALVFLNYNK